MDTETIRTIARLARSRAERGSAAAQGDGLMRLGATRALHQLAVDLEVSTAELDRSAAPKRRRR